MKRSISFFSPMTFVIVEIVLLCAFTFIPPAFYETVVKERDFMWFNFELMSFFLGIGASFCLGYLTFAAFLGHGKTKPPRFVPTWALLLPLWTATVLGLVSMFILVGNSPNIVSLILSGAGDRVKRELDTTGGLTLAQPLLQATIWWVIFQYSSIRAIPSYRRSTVVRLSLVVAILVALLLSVLKFARFELLPFIFGAVLSLLIARGRTQTVILSRLIGVAALSGVGIVGLFSLMALMRGQGGSSGVMASLMGYGPAAVNHLAIALSGRLSFGASGSGSYTYSFLSELPFLHDVNALPSWLRTLPYNMIYKNEFRYTYNVGLNSTYNWVTAPGYVWMDLGAWVFAYFCGLGALAALVWRSVRLGNGAFIPFYSFLCSTILIWFAFNMLNHPNAFPYLAVSVMLTVYLRLVSRPLTPKATFADQKPASLRGLIFGAEPKRAAPLSNDAS